MDDPKKVAKAAKKAAKAQAKLEKKLTKGDAEPVGAPPGATATPPAAPKEQSPAPAERLVAAQPGATAAPPPATEEQRPTPAERSAAAAERQVQLQKYRVWLAIIAALIALAAFLATVKPWTYFQASDTPTESSPVTAPENP